MGVEYPHRHVASLGIVGLGQGSAFALNLVADGHRVLAYDRNPAHVAALRADGAIAVIDAPSDR
jgi:3-hydroxyisobutyrate dehydrogenase-like beta-hydroxyacid dehydrogenase